VALLVWSMMGIAVWHFAVFVPDRFAGGIIGAFIGAVIGADALGLVVQGTAGRDIDDTDIGTAIIAIPGALLGLAAVYALGVWREQSARA
jgi:hypothetical protein